MKTGKTGLILSYSINFFAMGGGGERGGRVQKPYLGLKLNSQAHYLINHLLSRRFLF